MTTTVVRLARRLWRRLISMRTALVLLFLLALAAVPGSLLPQRPLNPTKVDNYLRTHGAWGHFLDRIGMFDVFGSAWFAAIYLLLFVSLVGCLVPRIRLHARNVMAKPPRAPKNLDRLPESGRFEAGDSAAVYAATARAVLGRRWRVVRRDEPSGVITLSAEKGYTRETGNLLFHVALLTALVLIAVGRLYSYSGSRVVVQGDGFCNVVAQYDAWHPGRFAEEGKIAPAPFCLTMNRFVATYLDTGEPSQFAADVTYHRVNGDGSDGPNISHHITVNHPLRLQGDRVYVIGHGYAPKVTVRMPDGSTREDVMPFIPSDQTTFLSEGAFKEYGKQFANRDIGVEGFFAPTPADTGNGTITSIAPQVSDPILGIFVYQGTLNPDGVPQSVYSLNKTKLHRIGQANLRVGQSLKLANGVSVRFEGWVPWASLQVSHDPTQGYLLLVAGAAVLGLIASLSVRRRRLWLRITPPAPDESGSPTVVSVGGLARSDSGNFTTEFAGILERLRGAATVAEPNAADLPVGAGKE